MIKDDELLRIINKNPEKGDEHKNMDTFLIFLCLFFIMI